MRPTDTSRWFLAGAVVFVALALAASAVKVGREGSGAAAPSVSGANQDPLPAELERCDAITPARPRDDACERAWAESRRRFLGAPGQPTAPSANGTVHPAPSGERP